MGNLNQLQYVQRHRQAFTPPYLEVGSHNYGSTQDLRTVFNDGPYVGVDMIAGPGVDLVLDLTQPFEAVDQALEGKRFGGIFCASVLEHCAQPFQMASLLTNLLKPGGALYISVPFAWKFHGYPSDYWRFTHEGVKLLFPNLHFDDADGRWCTDGDDDTGPLGTELSKLYTRSSWHRQQGRYVHSFGAGVTKVLGMLGPMKWLTRHRYVLPPTMIDMVGILPPKPSP